MKYYIVVTPFFPSLNSFRGSFIYDQVKVLQRYGKNVIVFKPGGSESYTYEGISVHSFSCKELPSYLFNGYYNKFNGEQFIKKIQSLGISLRDIEIIHCHTSSFGAMGVALKRQNHDVKFLLQHHDKDPYMIKNGKFAWFYPNRWYRAYKSIRVFNEVDCHVCISDAVIENLLSFPKPGEHETYRIYKNRTRFLHLLPKIKIKRHIKLYNGVDVSKFFKIDGYQKSEKFVIGCVANFVELKHQLDLIKAVEALVNLHGLDDIRLILIGSGPTKRKCEDYVNAQGLTDIVLFRHEVGHAELNKFYNSLNLFVLPSVFEGFGCVCTEAAAAGVPYIVCKYQGASEYIASDEQDVWTYHPGDIEELTRLLYDCHGNMRSQNLIYPVDIDTLVGNFLNEIYK